MAITTNTTINTTDWTLVTLTGASMVVTPLYGNNKVIKWSASNPPVNIPDKAPNLPKDGGLFDFSIYVKSNKIPYDISVTQ